MLLIQRAVRVTGSTQHPTVAVGQHLLLAGIQLAWLRLKDPLGVGVNLVFQMLLLHTRLRLQLLVEHPFLLNLLRLHLGLHTLLTRDLITGLVRVIHGVDGLCKACKRQQHG